MLLICVAIAACGTQSKIEPVNSTPSLESSSALDEDATYSTNSYSTTGTDQTVDEIVAKLVPKKPEILGVANLGEYKGLQLSFKTKVITEEDVQAYLDEYVLPAYMKRKNISDLEDSDIVLDDAAIHEIDPSFHSLEEYKTHIKQLLTEEAEYTNMLQLYYTAINAVIRNSDPKPTDEAVEWQIDYYLKAYYDEVSSYYDGMTMDDVVKLYGTTYQGFRESLYDYAVESVNQMLIMDAIADQEELEVSDEDIEKYAAAHGLTSELLREATSEEDLLVSVRREMAAQFVVEHAIILESG